MEIAVPKVKDYTKEENRLQSFSTLYPWKSSDITPRELAREGFCYKGSGDCVECHSCGVKIHNWFKRTGENLRNDHCMLNGSGCTFLQNLMKKSTLINARNLFKTKPDFRTEDDRFKSFYQHKKWPHTFLHPSELAMLGFHYRGYQDCVECYFCKIRLSDWKTTDNIIDKHYRFLLAAPLCPLLRGTAKENVPSINAERLKQRLRCFFYSKKQENDRFQKLNEEVTQKLDKVKISSQQKKTNDDSDNICTICLEEKFDHVFLPCGHVATCSKCAPKLTICCICRRQIESTHKLYFT